MTLTLSPVVWSEPEATAKLTAVSAAPARNDQRVGAGVAVDRDFRTVINDGVVAGAGIDGVGAADAVDRVVARAADDGVCAGRTRDR